MDIRHGMGIRCWSVLLALGMWACSPSAPSPPAPTQALPTSRPKPRALAKGLQPVIREIGRGRFEAARELALAFGKLHPEEGQADFLVGMSFEKAGNYGAAQGWFEAALEKAPDYFIVHGYLGRSHWMLGQLDEAREQYRIFATIDPREPKAIYGLGLIELEESQLDEAKVSFQNALELFETLRKEDPRMYQARAAERAACHARLADVYFALDRYAEARDELLRSTQLAPKNISAFYTLSLVQRRLGDEASAERAWQIYEHERKALTLAEEQR